MHTIGLKHTVVAVPELLLDVQLLAKVNQSDRSSYWGFLVHFYTPGRLDDLSSHWGILPFLRCQTRLVFEAWSEGHVTCMACSNCGLFLTLNLWWVTTWFELSAPGSTAGHLWWHWRDKEAAGPLRVLWEEISCAVALDWIWERSAFSRPVLFSLSVSLSHPWWLNNMQFCFIQMATDIQWVPSV